MMKRLLITTLLSAAMTHSLVAQSGERLRASGPDFVADGVRHSTRFDGDGAHLTVRDPDAYMPPVRLDLRLRDWGRGGNRAPADKARPVAAGGSRVRYDHGDIRERYEATATGFEQSFEILGRPTGAGDLILGLSASSPTLTAAPLGAEHQAITFRAVTGQEVRYGEAFAFERGGQPVPIATRYDGAGRIELIVPAAFVDRARFPIVVDPVVGPPLQLGGTSFDDFECDIAFDPRNEVYMAVWRRQFGVNDQRIRTQRYDRDGNPLAPVFQITSSGYAVDPAIAFMDTGTEQLFYIVWSASNGLWGEFYGSDGSVWPWHSLSSASLGTRLRNPCISTGTDRLVVMWDRTPSGASEPDAIQSVGVWRQTSTSVFVGNVATRFTGAVRRPRMPRSFQQFSGSRLHVVFEQFYASPAPGDWDLRHRLFQVGSTSMFAIANTMTVPGAGNIGADDFCADFASLDIPGAPKHLVAWETGGDIHAVGINEFGGFGSPVVVADGPATQTCPAIGAGRCEFSVGYLSTTSSVGPTDVLAARVSETGAVLATGLPVDTGGNAIQSGLRATSTTRAGPLESDNLVMFAWQRESAGGLAIRDVRAARFEPLSGLGIPYGSACAGPGGTLPQIDPVGTPSPGNENFELALSNAPPTTIAALLIGDQFASTALPGAPGCTLYMGLPIVSATPAIVDAAGSAVVPVPLPCSIPAGFGFACQWAIYTPGHNALDWITSDDVDLYWQH